LRRTAPARLHLLAAITDKETAREILQHLGIPAGLATARSWARDPDGLRAEFGRFRMEGCHRRRAWSMGALLGLGPPVERTTKQTLPSD
jgi:hypothetical protein